MRRTIVRLLNLFRNDRADAEFAREVASHLLLLEDEFIGRGMSPEQAALAARRAYGGVEQAKQSQRDERSILWLEQTAQDIRHGCRALIRTPGFTIVAVITLSLGIGVNTTVFSAYNAVALKPLPVAEPKTVVRVERWLKSGALGDVQYGFSYPEYVFCRDHQDTFSDLVAASWPVRVLASMDRANQAQTLYGQIVSGNYFTGLGINAGIGRTFGPDEDGAPGANPVIVLSYPFWQRGFKGDPNVVGKIIRIDGEAFTVVGVVPKAFTGTSVIPQVPDFWAPASMQPALVPGQNWLNRPAVFRFQLLARLRAGAPLKSAQAEMLGLIQQFSRADTSNDPTINITLQRTAFFGNTEDVRFEAGVATLMVIVGLVLLVACANVANMLLARGAARQREISVRMALGASRSRVVRHLLTENILLSLAGGLGGLVLAAFAGKLLWVAVQQMLTQMLGNVFTFNLNLNPDGRVVAYSLGISVFTAILFGLSPALQFTRKDMSLALKDEASMLGHRVSRSLMRKALITAQVTVSMLLLTSAGLLLRGLMKAQSASPGFDTQHLFLVRANFGDDRAKAASKSRLLYDALKTVPEIDNVASGTSPMLNTWTPPISVKDAGALRGELHDRTLASYASDSYFATLGIAIIGGRGFTPHEAATGAHVSIVSQSTARRLWPGEDPLGKHFQLDEKFDGKLSDYEVIGVAADVRFSNLTRIDPMHVYLATNNADLNPTLISVKVDPQNVLSSIFRAVERADRDLLPSLSLWNVETTLVAPRRSMARVLAAFAAILGLLALSLASVGIYGVMAYMVSQRTQEIGVRMALGATPGRVLRWVALPGLTPVAAGLCIGTLLGAGISIFLHSALVSPETNDFLYGVSYYDPWTFGALLCFLTLVSLLASTIPAIRALKVDPAIALRYE